MKRRRLPPTYYLQSVYGDRGQFGVYTLQHASFKLTHASPRYLPGQCKTPLFTFSVIRMRIILRCCPRNVAFMYFLMLFF